jgi:hypothetical protein
MELETRKKKCNKTKIKSKKKKEEIVRIGRMKEGECEKGSRKHKKDTRQLKKKDKRRFHGGSENPGTLDTRRKKGCSK